MDYTCKCYPGFEGKMCDKDIDDCKSHGCVHGTCKDGVMDYTCKCYPGFEGKMCDKAGVTGNKGLQFVDNLKPILDNLKSIMNTKPSPDSAIQQLQNKLRIWGRIAGVTGNKGPQFVDNLKPIMDNLKSIMNTNLSPESAIQQLQNKLQLRGRIGQLMMTWMKTTIETLMELNSMNGKAAAEPEVDE